MEIVIAIAVAVVVVIAVASALLLRGRTARGDIDPPVPPGGTLVEPFDPAATPTVTEAEVEAGLVEPPPAPSDVAEPEVAEPEVVEPEVVERPRFLDRLGRSRSAMWGYLGSVLGRSRIDQDTWDELEEALILADAGVGPATELIEAVRERVRADGVEDPTVVLSYLSQEMKQRLGADRTLRLDGDTTNVWLFVGVNGVGKTTSIGKVGRRLAAEGHPVLMAAGDTFRAAAGEQLETWAERAGAEFVRGSDSSDPGSVIFDGVQAAAARGCDVVLADTAGRLHTKTNLMEELSKVRRVADRDPGTVTEVLLVIDATTGQNGLTQAQQFAEAVDVTGVVLTKLDGSAKGGIVFAIETQLGIPVKLVGLGETADDLVDFDPDEFVDALLSPSGDESPP